MSTWKVYKHTTPSGKVYIGITCTSLVQRWKNGKAYKGCPKFNASIQKYGWDSILHECLYDGLSEMEAKSIETSLILEHKRLGISLNLTDGGDGVRKPVSDEARKKISQSLKKYYKSHPGTFTGRHVSDEAKAKIRDAAIRFNATRKGKPAPKESVEKMRTSIIEYFRTHENSTKGSIWIHRGNMKKRINPSALNQYLSEGWINGYK